MTTCHLQRHVNGFYYFRFPIPQYLWEYSDLFKTKSIHRSLKTRSRKLASISAHSLEARYELAITVLRSKLLPNDQLRQIVKMLLGIGPQKQPDIEQPIRKKAKDSKNIKLSRLIDLYIHEHEPAWVPKTRSEYASEFSVLLRLIGDRPIQEITRETCVSFRDRLLRLPPNITKCASWPKSIPRNVKEPLPSVTMSPITTNKYLVLFSSLFKWAAKQDYVPKNPAEGLKVPVRHQASADRAIYAQDDLQRLIDFLPKVATTPEQFWIPLIALFSGMRQGEICQLESSDICEIEGVACFDVNAKGEKVVKTPASIRKVPVHPMLVRLGFLEYVRSCRQTKQARLWPHLKQDKFGYWTREFSRWHRLFNRDCITDDPKKCFHSFRHTFADRLKQADVQDVVISELRGHANPNISTGRYGKPYHPGNLLIAIEKADYALSFSSLTNGSGERQDILTANAALNLELNTDRKRIFLTLAPTVYIPDIRGYQKDNSVLQTNFSLTPVESLATAFVLRKMLAGADANIAYQHDLLPNNRQEAKQYKSFSCHAAGDQVVLSIDAAGIGRSIAVQHPHAYSIVIWLETAATHLIQRSFNISS